MERRLHHLSRTCFLWVFLLLFQLHGLAQDSSRLLQKFDNQKYTSGNTTAGARSMISCADWLRLPSQPSYVRVGDLDIPGNQLTVEALIMRTTPYVGGRLYAGDVVSKHRDPVDVNYLLRPNSAEIATSSGYFITPEICEIELNKVYHVAMVYDGTALKFYRNGFLMSQTPVSGNMMQNDWQTQIGFYQAAIYNENFIGYIDEVRIWNVARTQTDIRNNMNGSLPNPNTQPGLLAYYTFDDLTNKQGNAAWNGVAGGTATFSQVTPVCSFVADSCVLGCPKANFDISLSLDPCDPLQVTFSGDGADNVQPAWSFGDGATNTGNLTPTHRYGQAGTYTIVYSVSNGICRDTVTKLIDIGLAAANIIATADTTICAGQSKQLRSGPSLGSCWQPAAYLDEPSSSNPVATPPATTTFYLRQLVEGNNLITNGDFSKGNTDFTSQYTYSSSGLPPGVYFVGTNPNAWNPGMPACGDHGSGTGNMLLVNGSQQDNTVVWTQTIQIQPNTTYAFSTWLEHITTVNPAMLQFSINGVNLGTIFQANSISCLWERFHTTWNSGNNTTAVIAIVNKNLQYGGNAFALDDIYFAPVYLREDSVVVSVDNPYVFAGRDTTVCEGSSVQLGASGAAQYQWEQKPGLSNTNTANPLLLPVASDNYVVNGISTFGCSAKDTVAVNVLARPVITISTDTLVCVMSPVPLQATGGVAYSWAPVAGLSDPSAANPVADGAKSQTYVVTVTDANSCVGLDSVQVNVREKPVFSVDVPVPICEGGTAQLNAFGGDLYSWSPAAFLNNAQIADPLASPGGSTDFQVAVMDTICNETAILNASVIVHPNPKVIAAKSNDIDCIEPNSQLTVSGAVNYIWSPPTGLNNPNIAYPLASPSATTTYVVTGADVDGCTGRDSVTVLVTNAGGGGFFVPNAFTPNGDGRNDCFSLRFWSRVEQFELWIYNRWGQLVFHSSDVSDCWDGTFSGKPQPADTYVYQIRSTSSCSDRPLYKKGLVTIIR